MTKKYNKLAEYDRGFKDGYSHNDAFIESLKRSLDIERRYTKNLKRRLRASKNEAKVCKVLLFGLLILWAAVGPMPW